MEIIRNIAPASQWGIKCPYQITPNRIVVHNTANDASADNEIAYMISNDNEISPVVLVMISWIPYHVSS